MKKFNKDGKINFVDENNVFVGYDLSQGCCEDADWFISEKEENTINNKSKKYDISTYTFATEYFKEVVSKDIDEGGMVRFKLIASNKPDLFLHLFNHHNGYYSHGFEAEIEGKKWQNGRL